MPSLRIKRGTRAQLDAAAAASGLKQGELYLITDENRHAVGIAVDAYIDIATGPKITVSATAPTSPKVNDIWIDIS